MEYPKQEQQDKKNFKKKPVTAKHTKQKSYDCISINTKNYKIMKQPFFCKKLLKKIRKSSSKKEPIKTWSRATTILPEMVGFIICVHNRKTFIPVLIQENMVRHKLGEFSLTRTRKQAKKSKKQSKK